MPVSLATHGKDSVTLGLTYASRSLSAAETQVLVKDKTIAATEMISIRLSSLLARKFVV
jgi:hypothetical protein